MASHDGVDFSRSTLSRRHRFSHANVRSRPLTFLWASYPRASPPSVDGTDWLSMLPALGVGFRPSARRTRSRRASWIRASVPLLRHSSKYPQTVLLGGKSLGKNSHWQPVRRM